MKQYKGYYIDGVWFHSEEEIDNFLKEKAIKNYSRMARKFVNDPSMELTVMMSDEADRIHKLFGLSYAEIEDIEIEAMKTA